MSQLFNFNGRWVALEEYKKLLNPVNEETSAEDENNLTISKYAELKFAELKKIAKERGIKTVNTDKAVDVIALLEQYDNLKDGDVFQNQIAKFATEEMITENGLESDIKVGDLFFIPVVEE